MKQKAWSSIEEVPYCFFGVIHQISRSHGLINRRFESNFSKITRAVAAIKSLRFALLELWLVTDWWPHSIKPVHAYKEEAWQQGPQCSSYWGDQWAFQEVVPGGPEWLADPSPQAGSYHPFHQPGPTGKHHLTVVKGKVPPERAGRSWCCHCQPPVWSPGIPPREWRTSAVWKT